MSKYTYKYVTKYDSPNSGYNGFTKGHNDPKYIVIHHWGAEGQSFWGVVNWLCNPRAYSSAHYVVEGNLVACILNQSDCGWHTGNKWYNMHSIGIECRPEMDQTDLNTVAALIAQIWKDVGKELPLIGHKDIVATACPGKYYSQLKVLRDTAREIYNGSIEIKPEIITPEKPKPEPRGEMYRVRTSWKNVKSQIGAFRNKQAAINLASTRNGYKVYDIDGRLVWEKPNTPNGDVFDTNRSLTPKEAIKAGQAWSNKILGTNIAVDGKVGPATRKNGVKVLQWAMNKDYNAGLAIDGSFGPASRAALGDHYVRHGERQKMVYALQVLLLMNAWNPHGVDGAFGDGCLKATKLFQENNGLSVDGIAGKNTFLKLIKL